MQEYFTRLHEHANDFANQPDSNFAGMHLPNQAIYVGRGYHYGAAVKQLSRNTSIVNGVVGAKHYQY